MKIHSVRLRIRSVLVAAVCLTSWFLLQGLANASDPPRIINILDLENGTTKRLTQVVGRPNMGSPVWSFDGNHIAFDACGKDGDFSNSHLYVVRSDGTWPRHLGPGAVPSWSQDGSTIAFHLYGQDAGVWVTSALNGAARYRVAADGGSPRYRPQHKTLAYLQWGRNINEIDWNQVDDKGQPKVSPLLPAGLSPYWGWSWSPDGDAVCFMSRRSGDSDKRELLVVRLNRVEGADKEPEVISCATGPIYTHVSWSPDGGQILFSMKGKKDNYFQLYTVNPNGKESPVRVGRQIKDWHNVDGTWSPDGKKIAYVIEGYPAPQKAEAEEVEVEAESDDLVSAKKSE